VGVYGVDTREITKIIRESGVMNAQITTNPNKVDYEKIKEYKVTKAVESVSTDKPELLPSNERTLIKKAEDILKLGVDGVMLSNGPGDPSENTEAVEELKKLIGKVPIFGICLGHQLLALAMGGETTKLKYGHRGVNQPVKNLETGRTYISSQNHGYAVVSESIEKNGGVIMYVNANDNTCEGVDYPDKLAFSVQFHPEACSGPHDTQFIFDKFIKMMGGNK